VVTFTHRFEPATAESIQAFEVALSVTLPADYKEFLRTINGGVPEPQCFNVPERDDALCAILYSIRNSRQPGDLEWEQGEASQWDPLPAGMVAIGHDPGGNTFLIATSGKNVGTIYFWDRNGLWVREDGRNTFPVATSFTAFLSGLRDMPVG
jgi:hypothetical protein